jgi:kumamolisin
MKLRGSEREPVPRAHRLGSIVGTDRVELAILLRRSTLSLPFPDVGRVGQLPVGSRRYMTREEFVRLHGARPDDVETIRTFARDAGLEVGAVSMAARIVQLTGPAGVVAQQFGVSLGRWTHPGGSYRGRIGPINLPDGFEEAVVGVFGLDNRPQARTHFRRNKTPGPSDVAYSPPTVAEAYSYPAGTDGSGETIALLELGGGFTASDLTNFFGHLDLPTPSVTTVSVDGATNSPTGDPDGPDGEVELDLEVAGSVAPGCRFVVYFAPNTDRGFLDGLTTAIHDTVHRPSIVSISWGGPEDSWTAQAQAALNSAIQDAATLGVSVVIAAGDNGATDGEVSGSLTVDFPASSPFAVACGGTRLLLDGGRIASEVVWNEIATREGATGGGVSRIFARPSYQVKANVPSAPNGFVGRGVPDVAGNADPASGYSVFVDGHSTVIGGTSAVAPLWAALLARFNQKLGGSVGFANPFFYTPAGAASFHDVTIGNNDGYSAAPGWDPCTGWGTPDGVALLQVLLAKGPPPGKGPP